jgi:hypothetical protein
MADVAALEAAVTKQGVVVRELKAAMAPKPEVDAAVSGKSIFCCALQLRVLLRACEHIRCSFSALEMQYWIYPLGEHCP